MNERRKEKCPTSNCQGIHYIESGFIHCTKCEFSIPAKRKLDEQVKTFVELRREFNGF